MATLVLYESMYGNTRRIAEAIARGIAARSPVQVLPIATAVRDQIADADLVVVGGPTHIWSMSRPKTRQAAVEAAQKPNSGLTLDPCATAPGIREWLGGLSVKPRLAAAFDTRLKMPSLVTGRAAWRIAKVLRHNGVSLLGPATSFLVTKQNVLCDGEEERAEAWGHDLATRLMSRADSNR